MIDDANRAIGVHLGAYDRTQRLRADATRSRRGRVLARVKAIDGFSSRADRRGVTAKQVLFEI